jgi:hypothetical protein
MGVEAKIKNSRGLRLGLDMCSKTTISVLFKENLHIFKTLT